MPLMLNEIVPGAVAILDPRLLLEQPDVKHSSDDIPFRSGPFLCVQVKDGSSAWLNITTKKDRRGLRLELLTEWRLDGSKIWRSGPQYIHDVRKPFVGPNEAFVIAGANERHHRSHRRPRVAPEGVAAVVAEMQKYGVNAL
jgi:hypothetical protein